MPGSKQILNRNTLIFSLSSQRVAAKPVERVFAPCSVSSTCLTRTSLLLGEHLEHLEFLEHLDHLKYTFLDFPSVFQALPSLFHRSSIALPSLFHGLPPLFHRSSMVFRHSSIALSIAHVHGFRWNEIFVKGGEDVTMLPHTSENITVLDTSSLSVSQSNRSLFFPLFFSCSFAITLETLFN